MNEYTENKLVRTQKIDIFSQKVDIKDLCYT